MSDQLRLPDAPRRYRSASTASQQLRFTDVRPWAPREGAVGAYPDYRSIAIFLIVVCVVFSGLRYSYRMCQVPLHVEGNFYDLGHFYFYGELIREGKDYWDEEAIADHAKVVKYRWAGPEAFSLPAVYLAFTPLTYLGFDKARLAWTAIDQLALLLALGLIVTTLQLHKKPLILAAFAFMVFNYTPLRLNAQCGQTNNVLLLMLALCFFLHSRERKFLAGCALAVAAVAKFTPAVIFGYFLWKREFKVCLGFLFMVGLCLVVPMCILGVEAQVQQMGNFALHASVHAFPGWPVHHSLGNALARILGEPGSRLTEGQIMLIKSIVGLFSLTILAIAAWLTWPRKHVVAHQQAFEYSLAIGTPLVVSSILEIHHFVWLLLPFAVLLTTPTYAQPKHFWAWLGGVYVVLGLEYWPDRFEIFHHGIPSIVLMGKLVAVVAIWTLIAAVLKRMLSHARSAHA